RRRICRLSSSLRHRGYGVAMMPTAIIFLLLTVAAQAADRPYLAVIEKVAGAVGFYSEDGTQLGLVKVGAFPHEAVLSRDGRFLYVSDNGVLWMTEDALGSNVISVVDVTAMKKVH